MKASMKKINLPSAPKPARIPQGITRSDRAKAEHFKRVREHKEAQQPAKLTRSPFGRRAIWTREKNDRLIMLWEAGTGIDDITEDLQMERKQVTGRLSYLHSLGITKPRRPKMTKVRAEKILELKAQGGLTHPAIAEKAGVSVASVNRVLQKARLKDETESD